MRYVEKAILLQTLDHNWREHIVNLDHLRQYVGLRGYGQRDPLNEYKSEAFELFEALLAKLRTEVIAAADACADPDRRAAAELEQPPLPAMQATHIDPLTGEDEVAPAPAGTAARRRRSIPTIRRPGPRSSAMRRARAARAANTSTATARWSEAAALRLHLAAFARYRFAT